jgi:hypothetical protein
MKLMENPPKNPVYPVNPVQKSLRSKQTNNFVKAFRFIEIKNTSSKIQ